MEQSAAAQAASVVHYDPVAKSLHWVILLLVIIQFASAWLLPDAFGIIDFETLIAVHMSFGITILAAMIVRTIWRLTHPIPENDTSSPRWQRVIARLTHYAFYGLLVLLPLLGWAWASSMGIAVRIFWLVTLPPLVAGGSAIGNIAGTLHSGLAIVLLFVIGLHVAAALYHQYIVGDAVVASMMPKKKSA